MKNRNIILGSFAIALALMSSSFATISDEASLQDVYVKVKQFASQQYFTCERVENVPDATCNGLSTNDCRIIIILNPSGVGETVAHSDSGCTIRYKDNTKNLDTYLISQPWDPQVVF